jgi:hypothetical protein
LAYLAYVALLACWPLGLLTVGCWLVGLLACWLVVREIC